MVYAAFQEVSGLENAQGSSMLLLQWGVTDNARLWLWRKKAIDGDIEPKNGWIVLVDRAGKERIRWSFARGWPTKWVGPSFGARTERISVETLEIAHEGIKRWGEVRSNRILRLLSYVSKKWKHLFPKPIPEPQPGRNTYLEVPVERQANKVNFGVYHPKRIMPGTWSGLLVYVYLSDALSAIQSDSKARLGHKKAKSYGTVRAAATKDVGRGAQIRVVPDLPGCVLNPPNASLLWCEDWHRVEFRFQRLPDWSKFAQETDVHGSVSFYVGAVLIGQVTISTQLVADVEEPIWGQLAFQRSDVYRSIFVSYSHKDTKIVKQLEKAYQVLGDEYLRDIRALRSGEKWHPKLLEMIEQADVFQLCWSSHAKDSSYVEQEWRHALKQRRPSFIRPVYWEKPMPPPPPPLTSIHFAYLDLGWYRQILILMKVGWQKLTRWLSLA
jgi:phage tail-like protein